MPYTEYPPHPGLRKHIRCYWTYESSGIASPGERIQFLTEGLEFALNVNEISGDDVSDAETDARIRSCIFGPMTRPMRLQLPKTIKIFGICFRPGGATPFFSSAPCELMNSRMEISDLWEPDCLDVIARVQNGCETTAGRMVLLDAHFLRRLGAKDKQDFFISNAVELIESHQGNINIDVLSKSVGLSSRQLERRFREQVGMPPKQLCRSLRFKKLFHRFAAFPAVSLAAVATDCGYYDQSHMIRDFKFYTGESPAAYIRKTGSTERFFIGNF